MYPLQRITQIKYSIIINAMQQEEEKILSEAIGKVLSDIRKDTGKSLNLFCNEFGLSSSTYNDIERGVASPKVFSILKVLKAYNVTPQEFFTILEKELPTNFLEPEI